MTSSSPSRTKAAGAPSTLTELTESPEKSRSKRESACVARAWIVSTTGMVCTESVVAYARSRV